MLKSERVKTNSWAFTCIENHWITVNFKWTLWINFNNEHEHD
jgi:hypothetical protein